WERASAKQAIPMLSIPKKSGKLRTVFDFHLQNDNTEKDITPFPDKDTIWLLGTRSDVDWIGSELSLTKIGMSQYLEMHGISDDLENRDPKLNYMGIGFNLWVASSWISSALVFWT
ncbi:hypothetical protein K439DRAFT_1348934, partial [Ramaria rubella]